jgi:hypothetical protein
MTVDATENASGGTGGTPAGGYIPSGTIEEFVNWWSVILRS